ncbi:conserved domain protein [Pseudomonas chlororaphis subsp. aurantiaca]|nr:conserved domain protein [Pseudomonas chlororaphis subsp. aurantiaca]
MGFFPLTLGPPLLCWAIGHTIVNYFPHVWFRPPKGPLWELNRRTGLVTFFDYKHFKKDGVIDEVIAPFYEFDAYIVTSPDRQGLPMNGLFLIHRYRDIRINFNDLSTPDNTTQKPCALWDFLQNFMDVSRPLPELPRYESHRHLDPVTAEYDRKTGREPRYWIDMDNDTFKAKVKEMLGRIDVIDTFSRPNLMAKHVKYVD